MSSNLSPTDPLADAMADRIWERLAERLNAPPAAPEYLTVEEAAACLRCGPRRIYALVKQGRLRGFHEGRRLLIAPETIREYEDASR